MYDYDTFQGFEMVGTFGADLAPVRMTIGEYDWDTDGLYVSDTENTVLVTPTRTDQPIGGPDQEWVGVDPAGRQYRLKFDPESWRKA